MELPCRISERGSRPPRRSKAKRAATLIHTSRTTASITITIITIRRESGGVAPFANGVGGFFLSFSIFPKIQNKIQNSIFHFRDHSMIAFFSSFFYDVYGRWRGGGKGVPGI
jgi:hypothetical protein